MRGTIEIIEVGSFSPPRFDVRFRELAWRPTGEPGTMQQTVQVTMLVSEVEVPAPADWPVPNDATATLATALPWYLEVYPHQPTDAGRLRAAFVRQALRDWGTEVFETLLPPGETRDQFDMIASHALLPFGEVEIHSANADILAWPWEALRDPEGGRLGEVLTVRRHVGVNDGTYGTYQSATRDGPLRVLWLLSRSGPDDVSYREGIRAVASLEGVEVDLLRPATLDALHEALSAAPGKYDVLHVDCHGVWDGAGGRCLLQLHDAEADVHYVAAEDMVEALDAGEVRTVVLNACRSAMAGQDGEVAFQSLAVDLFDAESVLDVAAMAYKFPAASAAPFLHSFYAAFRDGKSLGEAMSHGRFGMETESFENGLGEKFDTWLVPSAYGRAGWIPETVGNAVAGSSRPRLADDYRGHDQQMYLLDHLDPTARGMAITGLAGCGKSRFLKEWVTWRQATGSDELYILVDGSATEGWSGVMTRVSQALGIERSGSGAEHDDREDQAIAALEERGGWILIDDADALDAPETDGVRLIEALAASRRVRTVLAFTGPKPWMRAFHGMSGLSLSSMEAEARHPLVAFLAHDFLGAEASQDERDALADRLASPELGALISYVAGNPALMRWIARNIAAGHDPDELRIALREGGTEALLRFGGQAELEPVLKRFEVFKDPAVAALAPLLAMHDELVDWRLIEKMVIKLPEIADHVGPAQYALRSHGLLEQYGLHPALGGELRSRTAGSETVPLKRAFASVMAADLLEPESVNPPTRKTFGSLARAQEFLFEVGDCQLALRVNGGMRENYIRRGMPAEAMRTARELYRQLDDASDDAFEAMVFEVIDAAQLVGDADFAKRCLAHPRLVAMCSRDQSLAALQVMFAAKITRLQGDYEAAMSLFEVAANSAKAGASRSMRTLLHIEREEETIATMIEREKAITAAMIASQGARAGAEGTDEDGGEGETGFDAEEFESGYSEGSPAELRERAQLEKSQGNLRRALRLADLAVRKEEANGFRQGLAVCLSTRADILAKLGETDQARDGYERAIGIFDEMGDVRSAAVSYHQWGKAAHLAGLYQEAAESFVLSAKLFQQCGDAATVTLIARNYEIFLRELDSVEFGAFFALQWTAKGLPRTPGLSALGGQVGSLMTRDQGDISNG